MLRLTATTDSLIPIEADVLAPDRLAGRSARDIAKLAVQHGNAQVELGEFFRVEGDAGDQHLVIEGDCRRVKLIGSAMISGRIDIHGDAGMHVGADMIGGEIHVHGRVGDWAGAEMRGGLLHVRGDAGHQLGAGYRGARHGMRGGEILVEGNAGNEVGARMRRGLIAVGGRTGDFAGIDLIAGSIFIFGLAGPRLGAGMKRGSIVLFGGRPEFLPTFTPSCVYEPTFIHLYLAHLAGRGFPPAGAIRHGTYRRYCGDRVSLGKGEILVWEHDT